MWSLNKIISRLSVFKKKASQEEITSGLPAIAIENPLSPSLTEEIIIQYKGDSEPIKTIDSVVLGLLSEFQSEYVSRIKERYRPLAEALLHFNYVLIDDEAHIRTETRLGLKSFLLAKSAPSPAENIVGEYGDAPNVINQCLPSLNPEKKYIFIMDGRFPSGSKELASWMHGAEAVLNEIKLKKISNIFVIIRTGEVSTFQDTMESYPFVLGILAKSSHSVLFQWALSQNPDTIKKIIEKAHSAR